MATRVVAVSALIALCALTACSSKSDKPSVSATGAAADLVGQVVTISMAQVGDVGNKSVGVIQTFGGPKGKFVDPPNGTGIYKTCADAPKAPPSCLTVGGVDYKYGIGEYEATVSQYVAFLNTADREGKNLHALYADYMSPEVWAKYGSISYSPTAAAGQHYTVAFPQWAQKPFNFGNFRQGARFANSLTNGKILSEMASTSGGFSYETYKVRLSPETEKGMYDLTTETPMRTKSTGFVVSSNNEWIKAAYYDPKGGGTQSYWAYPTGPFNPPNPTKLNPATGDVINADHQPLATYNPNDPNGDLDTPGSPAGAAPTWCPPQVGDQACDTVSPLNFTFPPGKSLQTEFQGNLSTVGQAKTASPWGTYDQGGNVVEVTDSLAPQPTGYHFIRDWRYYHGGVTNAPAYQVEISAFGYDPGDHPVLQETKPWTGFRLGFIGGASASASPTSSN